jgi:hypothetical protein
MAQSSCEIYWSAILADFRRSGLTHVEFCRLRHISIHSFRDWLYRLRPGLPPRRSRSDRPTPAPSSASNQSNTPDFLPVHVRPRSAAPIAGHQATQPRASLELVLSDRAHLRIPAGFDPATLHQLLDVLEQRS